MYIKTRAQSFCMGAMIEVPVTMLIGCVTCAGATPLTMSQNHNALTIGGFRGGRTWREGTQFFRFDIQMLRNVAASRVHAPHYEVHAPPTGNPGSATGRDV